MANTNAPFGFVPYRGNGATPTYELSTRQIAYNNTDNIFRGDAVIPLTTGYIGLKVAGDTVRVEGIFWGCKYTSVSQKRTVWSNYWPGADAVAGSVEAYVYSAPNMQFEVQASGTNGVLFANIGEYIDIANAGGSTATGISGMTVDSATLANTVTLPFIVVGLVDTPPGSPGTDSTAAYDRVIVAFNNASSRTNGGGPTGIA